MTVMLSDDEAIAVAAHSGVGWVTPLPTVAVHVTRDFGAALARGIRSLRLRGLVREEAGSPVLAEELTPFVTGVRATPGVIAQAVRVGSPDIPLGGLLMASPISDGEVFFDLISADGVHDFQLVPKALARETVLDYIWGVFCSTAGQVDAELRAVVGPDGSLVTVMPNSIRVGDGAAVHEADRARAALEGALAEVFPAS